MLRFKQLVLGLALAPLIASAPAHASIRDTVNDFLDQVAQIAHPDAVTPAEPAIRWPTTHVIVPQATLQPPSLFEFNMPALPSVAVAELPDPSIETPLKKLFCVEYARARSGM